jgi:hypothetical protein
VKNEGSSGYIDENKHRQVSGGQGLAPTVGCRAEGTSSRLGCGSDGQITRKWTWQYIENEGSSGYIDENK